MNEIQSVVLAEGDPPQSFLTKDEAPATAQAVCRALGNATRWRLVTILADGPPKSVGDLAFAVGCKLNGVAKQLAYLRGTGIVTLCTPEGADGRYSWHEIPAKYRATAGVLDFGCCVVRL